MKRKVQESTPCTRNCNDMCFMGATSRYSMHREGRERALRGLARGVVLQDGGHRREVEPTRGHIGAQQHARRRAREFQEGLRAHALRVAST